MSRKNTACMVLIAAIASLSSSAQGNVSLRVDLETKYQNKIYSILKPIDPYAQVSVNVTLQTIETPLPGLRQDAVTMTSSTSDTELALDDIKKIEVEVRTQASPFPKQALTMIENSLGLPPSKRFVKINAFDSETLEFVHRSEKSESFSEIAHLLDQSNQLWTNILEKFFKWFVGAAGVLILLGIYRDRKSKKFNTEILSQAKEGISKLQGAQPNKEEAPWQDRAPKLREDDPKVSRQKNHAEDPGISSLPHTAALAIFSDCYWTSEDAYGSHLWNSFTQPQRETILKTWKHGKAYAAFLQSVDAIRNDHHLHPYYLNATSLEYTSMEDLEKTIRSNVGAWKLLSPIRQKAARFTLKERIQYWNSEAEPKGFTPPVSDAPRKLQEAFDSGKLSTQDEMEIFVNPDSIPFSLRSQVPSLVWVALLPKERRTELLLQFTARQLAQCWEGPAEVLVLVKEALPEKKMKLVEDFQSKFKVDRNSAIFSKLVQSALNFENENSGNQRVTDAA